MKKPVFLYTADLHLTSRDIDEYRWDIFKVLSTIITTKKVTDLFILGDLTDQKDKHSAKLVSKLIGALQTLTKLGVNIWILKGNHDYTNPSLPFFKFLDNLPRIRYFTYPENVVIAGKTFRFQPHTSEPFMWKRADFAGVDRLLIHQPIKGSIVANGWNLDGGMELTIFDSFKGKILAGDIHVPQTVGNKVRYIGSPHPIHFGDSHTPRVLLEQDNKFVNINLPSIKKLIIEIKISSHSDLEKVDNNIDLKIGDQIKVIVKLKRNFYPAWRDYRKKVLDYFLDKGVILCGLEIQELVDSKDFIERASNTEQALFNTISHQSPEALFKRFIVEKNIDKECELVGKKILESLDII